MEMATRVGQLSMGIARCLAAMTEDVVGIRDNREGGMITMNLTMIIMIIITKSAASRTGDNVCRGRSATMKQASGAEHPDRDHDHHNHDHNYSMLKYVRFPTDVVPKYV